MRVAVEHAELEHAADDEAVEDLPEAVLLRLRKIQDLRVASRVHELARQYARSGIVGKDARYAHERVTVE